MVAVAVAVGVGVRVLVGVEVDVAWVAVKPLVVHTGESPTQKLKSYRVAEMFSILQRQIHPLPP